jgi:cellulose 1,4-beta-cellobiosidase
VRRPRRPPGPDRHPGTDGPTSLTSTATTSNSVSLPWAASTDNVRVTGYDVYRGTAKVNAAPVTGTTYQDTGISPSTSYRYTVRARDAAADVSEPSAALTVTTASADTPTGAVKVRYKNNDASAADNAIRPSLQLVNTGSSTADLGIVSLRYSSVSAWCDYAAVTCAQVKLRVVLLTTPVQGRLPGGHLRRRLTRRGPGQR